MDCSLRGSSVHGFSRQEYWSGLLFPFPTLSIILWNCSCLEIHPTLGKTSPTPEKGKQPLLPLRRETGKSQVQFSVMMWAKHELKSQVYKAHRYCSRNFMWNTHYQAGLICLVNKLYVSCFYSACVLEAFLYNFWVHSGTLSLNIYDIPQLNFQRNPLWN